MAGLDPAIHVSLSGRKDVDARHKAGHDGERSRFLSAYAATFFPNPNASASRLYDFLRASWS